MSETPPYRAYVPRVPRADSAVRVSFCAGSVRRAETESSASERTGAFACLEPASAEPVPPKHRLDTFRPHILHPLRLITIRAPPATFLEVGRLIRDDRHLQALEQATAFLKCQADVLVPELFSGEYAHFTRSPGRTIGVNSIR